MNASLSHLSIHCVVCYTEHVLWLASDLFIHWSLCCCWVSTSRANGTVGCVLFHLNLSTPLCYRRSIHTLLLLWSCTYTTNRMVIVELTSRARIFHNLFVFLLFANLVQPWQTCRMATNTTPKFMNTIVVNYSGSSAQEPHNVQGSVWNQLKHNTLTYPSSVKMEWKHMAY